MEDYQLRKDIDRFKYFLDTLEAELAKQGITTINFSEIFNTIYDKSEVDLKFVTQDRFGFDQESAGKFNFAVISREVDGLVYEEMWFLINAYYDYSVQRFIKIDNTNASFGVQCQASGSYPGEQQLGYIITGIYFWRNPSHSDTYFDTVTYDYTDWSDKNYIGAKRNSDDSWVEFGIDSGWNNNFMIDNFGGMTIGGAGFEIDGNGIYPYGRLTSSVYSINGVSYYLLGILDNAYHPTFGNDAVWGCDTNSKYSWFIGLKIPEVSYLNKNTNNAKFVVMYNDTSADANNPHVLDKTKWHTVFEVDKDGVSGYLSSATASSTYATQSALNAVSNSLASTDSSLTTLYNDLVDFNEELISFDSSNTNLKTDLSKLKNNLSVFISSVTQLDSNLGELSSSLNTLDVQLNGDANTTGLTTTLSTLQNQLNGTNGLVSQLTTLQGQFTSLDGDTNELLTTLTTLSGYLTTFKGTLSEFQDQIIEDLGNEVYATLNSEIVQLFGAIASTQQDIDDVADGVSDINTTIGDANNPANGTIRKTINDVSSTATTANNQATDITKTIYSGTNGTGTKANPASGTVMSNLNQVQNTDIPEVQDILYGNGSAQNPATDSLLDVVDTVDSGLTTANGHIDTLQEKMYKGTSSNNPGTTSNPATGTLMKDMSTAKSNISTAQSEIGQLRTDFTGHTHTAQEVEYTDDNWYNDEIASSQNGHYYNANNEDITAGVKVNLDTAIDKIQTKVSGKAPLSHTHTTDDIRLAGTQYAITTMLNTMYSYYQQQSSASQSWSGDSQNHVYVRNIIWDSNRSEYKVTEDITDSISYGTILILNVASTNANHYGGHDLYSFYNNGVSMNVVSNADMELADYSTVMLIYSGGGATNSPMWIPILIDMKLCLTVDSSLVV